MDAVAVAVAVDVPLLEIEAAAVDEVFLLFRFQDSTTLVFRSGLESNTPLPIQANCPFLLTKRVHHASKRPSPLTYRIDFSHRRSPKQQVHNFG